MKHQISPQSHRALAALVCVSAAFAVAAPVAGATVTSTTITANTMKAWDILDRTDVGDIPINERTVSGTVDAGASAGDTVSVGCFNPISGAKDKDFATATVTAAKKWILAGSLYGLKNSYCRIVAVPVGTDSVAPADLTSKYKGSKVVTIGYWARSYQGLGGAAGNVFNYDYWFSMQSKSNSSWGIGSIGSCGLCGSKVRNQSDGSNGTGLWAWNSSNYDGYAAFPTAPASGPNADPLMLVDGKLAMDAYMASQRTSARQSAYRFGTSGGITVNYSINQTNGDVTITESQPLYRCVDVTDPSNWRSCGVVAQTGVRFNRVVTVTADHMIWRSADTYTSADGKAHSVRATYVNYADGNRAGYRFGTTGSYAGAVKGDKSGNALGVVAKNAYSVIGEKYDSGNSAVDASNSVGDIIMAPRPALVRVLSDGDKYMYARWSLSVPAKGSSPTVKQAYTSASSDANLVKLRNTAIAGLKK